MGMELEFDERALFDAKDSFYNRLVAYIDHFERQQAFRTSAMAYYSGNHAVLDMYKSTNPKDHEVMDRLANLIVSRRGKQKKKNLIRPKLLPIVDSGIHPDLHRTR